MSIKKLFFLVLLTATFTSGYTQPSPMVTDTISGFYLTKSHEGFTGFNYEKLVLKDKPSIYISAIEKVSQNFDYNGSPSVSIALNKQGTKELKRVSEEHIGQPMVLVFEKKIITAPIINSPIEHGFLQITGNFTIQETTSMVNWLKSKIKGL